MLQLQAGADAQGESAGTLQLCRSLTQPALFEFYLRDRLAQFCFRRFTLLLGCREIRNNVVPDLYTELWRIL